MRLVIYEKYVNECSLEEFKEIVKNSTSFNEVKQKLINLNYRNTREGIKKIIQSNNIDISHFMGMSWQKNYIDFSKYTNNSNCRPNRLTQGLILKRGHKCECCGNTKWLDKEIPLEVHHIDGDKTNNSPDNLVLLCPNCHSLTDNYKGKNMDTTNNCIEDEEFAEALKTSKNIRKALIKLGLTPKGANYNRAYQIAVKYQIKHILEH